MKELFIQFVKRPWSKEEKILTVLSATLIGLVLGLIFSPFKNGLHILSHNSNKITECGKKGKPDDKKNEVSDK